MHFKNLPTITVYRLENKKDGRGPFCGEQEAVNFLTPHRDHSLFSEEPGFPISPKIYNKLTLGGYLFSWINEEHYHKFFKRNKKINGEIEAYKLGFVKKEYQTNQYVIFDDGQVLFQPLEGVSPKDITPPLKAKRKNSKQTG